MSPGITTLPDNVASQIHSSAIITTLADVVLGLVKNSLDANATRIVISLDAARGNCVVEDDGIGVSHHRLNPRSPGNLHANDSNPDQSTSAARHPVNPTFLAALSALSLLTVVSQEKGHFSHTSVTWYRGNVVSLQTPGAQTQPKFFTSHGTRVVVRDLFGNMPVRVKHRALFSLKHPSKEWSAARSGIVALALAWTWPVSIRLVDVTDSKRFMYIPGHVDLHASSLRSISPPPLDIHRIFLILSRASLVPPDSQASFIPASAETPTIAIEGFISTHPVPHKSTQCIAVDVSPCPPQGSCGALYDAINQAFDKSTFGAFDDDDLSVSEGASSKAPRKRELAPRGIQKGPDRWPMFFLRISPRNLSGQDRHDLMSSCSDSIVSRILHVLTVLVHNWLKAHHYHTPSRSLPQKRTKLAASDESPTILKYTRPHATGSMVASPASASAENKRMLAAQSFSDWSRVKSSASQGKTLMQGGEPVRPSSAGLTVERIGSSTPSATTCTTQKRVDKIDPKPARTLPDPSEQSVNASWFASFFKNWHNPQFEPKPQLHTHLDSLAGRCRCCSSASSGTGHHERNTTLELTGDMPTSLSKAGISDAQVIAQVDHKYILVKMPVGCTVSLVLVDQHAASERCILEDLLAELCRPRSESSARHQPRTETGLQSSIDTVLLAMPLHFEMAFDEMELLSTRAQLFANWGILYNVAPVRTMQPRTSKIRVTFIALPDAIAERCSHAPRLLIELVRSTIWLEAAGDFGDGIRDKSCENDGFKSGVSGTRWVERLASCPTRLLDMISSRACRSAIMFNDPLSLDQCQRLIAKLSTCAFPFMCAHGRVSMVPLINLPLTRYDNDREFDGAVDRSFVSAFETWRSERE